MVPPGRPTVSVRVWDNLQSAISVIISGRLAQPSPGRGEGEGAGSGIGGSGSDGGERGESTPAC